MNLFLNIDNGIEWIPAMRETGDEYSFVRIQSTACEQKRFWFILEDLDYSFLMAAATGECCVFDGSSRKPISRALYQGVEWINYALNRHWLARITKPIVKGNDCSFYFNSLWNAKESERAKKKLSYMQKFVTVEKVRISGRCITTEHDGDYPFFRDILAQAA